MSDAGRDEPGDGRGHTVKDSLKPLRDRVVRGLGGTMPERGLTYDQLVHLVYPVLPDELRAEVDAAASGDLTQVSTIRRMLGSIEHQIAPTAFSVQLSEPDAVRCHVGPVELYADAADAAVTPGLRSGEYEPHLTAVFERYCQPRYDRRRCRRQPRVLLAPGGAPRGPRREGGGARAELRELPAVALVVAAQRRDERRVAPRCRRCLCRAGPTTRRMSGPTADWWTAATSSRTQGPSSRPFALDDLVSGPVAFLKMDVEGAEGRVVKGATRIIEHDRPIITTELKEEMLRRVSSTTRRGVPRLLRGSRLHALRSSRRTAVRRSRIPPSRHCWPTGATATNCATCCCCPPRTDGGQGNP